MLGDIMRERRLGFRIPLPRLFTGYIDDKATRVFCVDVSDAGLGLRAVAGRIPALGTAMSLEIDLPGLPETLWALGEVCYRKPGAFADDFGVRLRAMAGYHARLLRDYCLETRSGNLTAILERLRPVTT